MKTFTVLFCFMIYAVSCHAIVDQLNKLLGNTGNLLKEVTDSATDTLEEVGSTVKSTVKDVTQVLGSVLNQDSSSQNGLTEELTQKQILSSGILQDTSSLPVSKSSGYTTQTNLSEELTQKQSLASGIIQDSSSLPISKSTVSFDQLQVPVY
ncbi:uncharacterized protein LOC142318088 [Lycorma delicatula]|uniref:uncharacterized protein LOC142318088 n=1 Tax=Lycorma delicatula TaxID=130591 RepID=UPI003F510AB0